MNFVCTVLYVHTMPYPVFMYFINTTMCVYCTALCIINTKGVNHTFDD